MRKSLDTSIHSIILKFEESVLTGNRKIFICHEINIVAFIIKESSKIKRNKGTQIALISKLLSVELFHF